MEYASQTKVPWWVQNPSCAKANGMRMKRMKRMKNGMRMKGVDIE
jgi:hypothetical protein